MSTSETESRPKEIAAAKRLGGARVLIEQWRQLVGPNERTLVACSGGSDSCGVAIALASALGEPGGDRLVIAHIQHDLRNADETEADEANVRELARLLGTRFAAESVTVGGTRGEEDARTVRYQALMRLADRNACQAIATGHHADDQAETVMMRLIRGAGARGLGGMRASRTLDNGCRLIRPALEVTRQQLQEVCQSIGWDWREDPTNASTNRLRSALRLGVMQELEQLAPGVVERLGRTALMMANLDQLVNQIAREHLGEGQTNWTRDQLRAENPAVIGTAIRNATGNIGLDERGWKHIETIVRAINDRSTQPRTFQLAGAFSIRVTANQVEVVNNQK
ncbi:MAG: tRNA lysidine(34) synthetase TilS [Planctomycetota bacterium]